MQKVCSDTDTHASPQLPPWAALSWSCHVTKHKVLLLDDCISISLHIHTSHTLSHVPQLLLLCQQTSSPPLHMSETGLQWVTAPHWQRGCQYPQTLGWYTCKPPRACPTQVWDPASHIMRDTVGPLSVFLNQTHAQTPSQIPGQVHLF